MANKEDKRGIELDKDKLLEVKKYLSMHFPKSSKSKVMEDCQIYQRFIFSSKVKVVRTLRSKYDQRQ